VSVVGAGAVNAVGAGAGAVSVGEYDDDWKVVGGWIAVCTGAA